jgi:hypothetical protein
MRGGPSSGASPAAISLDGLLRASGLPSDGTLLFETEWASEVVEDVPPSGRLRLVLPARIPNEVFVADTPESGNGSGSS